jgi:hypothetical protein
MGNPRLVSSRLEEQQMRIHRSSGHNLVLAAATLLTAAFFGQGGAAAQEPTGKMSPEQRQTLLEAWRQARRERAGKGQTGTQAFGGTPAVGRPSMVINNSGTILYTKQFAGSACDPDQNDPNHWFASTTHAQSDTVLPTSGGGGFVFRATNAGTSGPTEPVWPTTFGSTIVDGTITWQATDRFRVSNRAYPLGTTVAPQSLQFGFTFQATQGGTTGGSPPAWPTVIGGTVTDGTVIWQARGFWPGAFAGCDPMQLISRASSGAETVLASEGDAVGGLGSQLGGWAELYAFNNSGQAAFRDEVAGRLSDRDESASSIFTAGPGAGALTEIAQSNATVGGRTMCGFSAMVGTNDVGQVLYDAYAPIVYAAWQASHSYSPSSIILPTVPNGFAFISSSASGVSGAIEPVWPTTAGATIADGTVVWTARVRGCNEDLHGITRFTAGPGNELLMAVGTDAGGGVTVVGFGNDVPPAFGPCGTSNCAYSDIDGFLNPAGHTSTVVRLSTGETAAYLLTGAGAFTQVARTGTAGPGGAFGRVYPRTSLNASDQVVFKAQVAGVDRMIRWTSPSTFAVVASVGDDIGTRSGGAASGTTITALGFYADINASGNVVFQATLSVGQKAYFFWGGSNGLITEVVREGTVPANLVSEMVTINDSNVVAFTSGASLPESAEGAAEQAETGLHTWTKAGGLQNQVRNGDTVNGFAVTGVQAQHPSFRRRQLNSAGCVATQFLANGANVQDAAEGSGAQRAGVPPGPQLFVGCAVSVPNTCTSDPTSLCLSGGRFRVQAHWATSDGRSGEGEAVQLTGDTGYFWFFSATNVEMVVKVLNACGFASRIWVFAGGLTNVQVDLTITDALTGTVKTYRNPQSTAFLPIQDTNAFATCSASLTSPLPTAAKERAAAPLPVERNVPSVEVFPLLSVGASPACTVDATTLCLSNGRFRVQANWVTSDGRSGAGQAAQLTSDTGYFWFFSATNVEMVVKVLNACGFASRIWVFAGGLTNVQVDLTITDTQNGTVKTYRNPQSTAFLPIQDTNAFTTCP